MINSGQGLYEKAIELGVVKMECHWQNLNTPTQDGWNGLIESALQITPPPWDWGSLPNSAVMLTAKSKVVIDPWVPGCPVYSRVTGSLHGYYIGKTKEGGCCIDSGDGNIDVESFDFVTSNEGDIKELQRARAVEQWEITIKHSNITTLATYLADKNVNNPM
ncbi:hypothetical protein NVP1232O_68 [Vibrio phage 1.232.O._10N.261.51.E11]|nr:hypothetical protein NVP1232O_68 [Vibrio phage 1.232.O._10N.261.51.E11]